MVDSSKDGHVVSSATTPEPGRDWHIVVIIFVGLFIMCAAQLLSPY